MKLQPTKSKKATKEKSCITCRYFMKCDSSLKSAKYRCVSWKSHQNSLAELAEQEAKDVLTYDLDFDFDPDKDQTRKFERALQELLVSESTQSSDIRVNDSEMPLAKNFFEFCIDRRFLGIKPYAKQTQVGIHLFGDACPNCSDSDWYRDIPFQATVKQIKNKISFMEHGICPNCKSNRADLIIDREIKEFFEAAILWGQRSGKSLMVSMLSAYILHHYLKINNPALYFNQLPNTVFHGTFVGLNFSGAKELLYDPFYNLIADSPWFREYHELLRDSEGKIGIELYKFKDTFIHYRHRNLLVYPQGPNKRTLRGRTRFLGGIDEIGHFDATSQDLVKLSAREIYQSMNNSFETLRSATRRLRKKGIVNIPKPMFLNISSPSSQLDMINQLYKRSQNSSRIYGLKAPTWEVNPNITMEDLAEDFQSNPVQAWQNYGVEPALSKAPFIEDLSVIKPSIKHMRENAAYLKPRIYHSKSGRKMMTGKLQWLHKEDKVPKLMSIDAGEVSNSFAISVAHNEYHNEDLITVFDLLLELIPSRENPISFTRIYQDVLVPVAKELKVEMVVADRWQSLKILTDLEEELDIEYSQYSVEYEDFLNFRNSLNEGHILFPRPKDKPSKFKDINLEGYPNSYIGRPVDHLVLQCLSVEDIPGKTVQKGEATTDDIFRSVVLNHSIVTQGDNALKFSGESKSARRGGIAALADQYSEIQAVPGIGNYVSGWTS